MAFQALGHFQRQQRFAGGDQIDPVDLRDVLGAQVQGLGLLAPVKPIACSNHGNYGADPYKHFHELPFPSMAVRWAQRTSLNRARVIKPSARGNNPRKRGTWQSAPDLCLRLRA